MPQTKHVWISGRHVIMSYDVLMGRLRYGNWGELNGETHGRWDPGRLRILTRETMGSVVDSTLARLDLRFGQSQYRGEKKDLRNQALKGFICRLASGNTFWVKMKEVCHEP